MILGEKDETYVIKLSNNPSDFFLFPIITSAFVLVAFYNPNPHIFTPVCFLVWALILVTVDFTFGFLHTLCHTHPYLRKLHMVHHEYRREDLNSFATFYSDFTDALFMNTPGMTNAILSVMFSLGPLPLNEMGISLGHTHHKYPNHQMTLCYFFEFDLIDMIMDRVRLSNYHHLHHHLTDQNFGVYGFISDEILLKGNQYIKSGYQSFVRSSKLYTYFKKGLSN
jgi:sterol desaturase/sphingolipid hydroxylase (fatty acid hydroxylase superfamily)